MDSSFDTSFNATALLEDHQLDTTDLLSADDDFFHHSPVKNQPSSAPKSPFQSLSSMSLPELPCQFSSPANGLFQVTHHLRQEQSLHNDKIHKLLQSLQGENGDFELDDQLRTRVFKARASRNTPLDSFDIHLDTYLRESDSGAGSPLKRRHVSSSNGVNENKENEGMTLEPSKRKLSDSARKPPLKKSRSYGSIPLLPSTSDPNRFTTSFSANSGKPLSTSLSTSFSIPSQMSQTGQYDVTLSPNRVCVPKAVSSPGKPNLKRRKNLRIFLIDSSTGSVADATHFGTELNASNCEGFPMPDNVNEVVQIPTNDTSGGSKAQKMAIIKARMGHYGSRTKASSQRGENSCKGGNCRENSRKGFYNRRQFDDKKARTNGATAQTVPQDDSGSVPVFQDETGSVPVFQDETASTTPGSTKQVRWADDLEW